MLLTIEIVHGLSGPDSLFCSVPKLRALQQQHEYRNEAVFQPRWREGRDQTIPSSEVLALSCKERLNATRERVLAKLSHGGNSICTTQETTH